MNAIGKNGKTKQQLNQFFSETPSYTFDDDKP